MACYETGVRTALSARSTFEVERWSLGGQRSMSHRRWSGAPARSYTASSVRGTSARSKSWRLSLREPPGEGAGPTGCRPGPRTCLEDCDRFWGADNLKPLAETVHGPNSRLTQESAGNRGWDGSSLRVSFSAAVVWGRAVPAPFLDPRRPARFRARLKIWPLFFLQPVYFASLNHSSQMNIVLIASLFASATLCTDRHRQGRK